MAAKFDVSALTLNAEEVKEVSKVIVEQAFINGNLADIHDIQTGIAHKQQILFVDNLPVGGKALSGCTPAEIAALGFTQKYWDPALVAGRFTHCANDENKLFKILKKATNVYPDFFEGLGNDVERMVSAIILTHIEESVLAKAWFSDTAAALIAGGGVFKAGTDVAIFNQFDGIFKQIFADATIPKTAIAKNAGANYAAQVLTDAEAFAVVKGVYDKADSRLKSSPDGRIMVTSEIYYGYLNHIQTTQNAGGIITTMIDGVVKVSYMGVPVMNMGTWTRNIIDFQDTGVKLNVPHRAVYTVKANIPLGTLSQDDLQNLDSFYYRKDNQNIIDYGYFLDAKLGEAYMTSVAY